MKTLIFDFDGTIADSFELLLETFEELVGRPQRLNKTEIEELRGLDLSKILKRLSIKKRQLPWLLFKGRRRMGQKITLVKPVNELVPVLNELHSQGYTMIILSSNSAANIGSFLRFNQLENNFMSVYGSVGLLSKAGALKKVMKKEGLNKTDCLYIGDEVRDIEAAKKIGIGLIAVGWGFNKPAALSSARPDKLVIQPRSLLEAVS